MCGRDWSSDVCSSDLCCHPPTPAARGHVSLAEWSRKSAALAASPRYPLPPVDEILGILVWMVQHGWRDL